MNIVSGCCYASIVQNVKKEYPLGGRTWGIGYIEEVCECCGEEAEEVAACGYCGEVENHLCEGVGMDDVNKCISAFEAC